MSTRPVATATLKELPTTPDHLRPLQQLVMRWGRTLTARKDITAIIIPKRLRIDIGAPARFVFATAQVHVPEEAFDGIDASKFRNIDAFIAKHPALAGRWVHEFGHARYSPDHTVLGPLRRKLTAREYDTLVMLMEGHCESWILGNLRPIERDALRAAVLSLILDDLVDENGEVDFASPRSAARLLGLIAARVDRNIVDLSEPNANAVYTAMVTAMGEFFDPFWELATKFADIEVEYWSDYVVQMTEIAKDWVALEDTFEQSSQPEEGEGEGKGEGEGEGEQTGNPEGGEPSEQEGGEGDGGQPDESSDQGGESGESDGVRALSEDDTGGTEQNDGTYGSGDSRLDPDAFKQAVEALAEAATDNERKADEVMKHYVAETQAATAEWDRKRKALNQEWRKQWR